MSASEFVQWFTKQGGSVSSSVEIVDYGRGMGRGAQATSSIDADEQLFAIPRDLVLSTSTASLPAKLAPEEWSAANKGWCGLILSMQYEASLGTHSRWHPYLQLLPTQFDSLMHWTSEELQELQGSTVVEKIGKDAAEADYYETVLPLLQKRADLFGPSKDLDQSAFSLKQYHTMGSLVLSRSFNVDPAGGDVGSESGEAAEGEAEQGDVSMGEASTSKADESNVSQLDGGDESDDEEEEEEEEGAAHVAMVPFADILNAKSGANNAELSYEEVCSRIVRLTRAACSRWIYAELFGHEECEADRKGRTDLVCLYSLFLQHDRAS